MHDVIRAELSGTGVRATLISPGPVDTEIWDEIDPDSKPGFTKRKDMMRAEDVAEAVVWAVTRPGRGDLSEIRLLPAGCGGAWGRSLLASRSPLPPLCG